MFYLFLFIDIFVQFFSYVFVQSIFQIFIYPVYSQPNFFKIYSSAVNNFITSSQHFTRNPLHIYSSCQSRMNIHI